jgi:hypothetical protein
MTPFLFFYFFINLTSGTQALLHHYFATSALTSRPCTSDWLSISFNPEICSNYKKIVEKW